MSAHPHKEIIDACTADTSIEIEEYVSLSEGSHVWIDIALESVIKRPHDTFRIKPKTRSITVDGVLYEWPEPMRVAPEYGTPYWYISAYQNKVYESSWINHEYDKEVLKIGFAQATREGTEAHRRALIAVSGGEL